MTFTSKVVVYHLKWANETNQNIDCCYAARCSKTVKQNKTVQNKLCEKISKHL